MKPRNHCVLQCLSACEQQPWLKSLVKRKQEFEALLRTFYEMVLIPSQFLKGFSFPLLRKGGSFESLLHTTDREGKFVYIFFLLHFSITESFKFSELIIPALIKGSAIFTACADVLQTVERRAVNLVGSGSYSKSHERKKDPISISLPLLPSSGQDKCTGKS